MGIGVAAPNVDNRHFLPARHIQPATRMSRTMKRKRLPKLQIVSLEQAKKAAILAAIEVSNGDVLLAAKRLGIGKTTLYNKLKKYRVRLRRLAELRDRAA
jgi:transcriptional regulator of acetoin/glycerol metabolism